ncbi:RecT family protein [Pseudanabaena phage Pan5]|nr:RecT family protein [Pseudanabaena phage Pan5]
MQTNLELTADPSKEIIPAEISETELEKIHPVPGTFGDKGSFEHAQRVAKMLSTSSLVPKDFQNNVQNTMIALEMANRIGASPLMVMQNLYIVHGKPSWSSSFIISAINASKKFSPLRFEVSGEGDQYGCMAWAYDLNTGEKLEGPKVTMAMANAEGWVNKAGSKWKTMPELMMRYRSAAFFGRLYAPEILMGMQTAEEVQDVEIRTVSTEEKVKALQDKLKSIQDGK